MDVFDPSSHGFKDSVAVDVENAHPHQIAKGYFWLFGFVEPTTFPSVAS